MKNHLFLFLVVLSSCTTVVDSLTYKPKYVIRHPQKLYGDTIGVKEKSYLKEIVNTIGLSKSELIHLFGAPDRVLSDGKEGEVVVYENHQSFMLNGTGGTQTSFKEFFLDKSGKVVRWRTGTK